VNARHPPAQQARLRGGLAALLVLLAACDVLAPPARRAFYSWRTVFSLSAAERGALEQQRVERLYLRFFDIDLVQAGSGPAAPAPIAPVTPGAQPALPRGVEIVPVVFLKNQALSHLGAGGAARLAEQLFAEVTKRAALLGAGPVRELQLDCDWTASTRDEYFALARAVQALANREGAQVSATIRLHQLKYRERTGVPPVARGMVMLYNLAPVSGAPGARAIYDPQIAESYLSRMDDYPLPLDVALPLFAWTVQSRGGRVERLLDGIAEADLEAEAGWLRKAGPGRFVAQESRFFQSGFVREGDQLQADAASPADALDAATRAAVHLARAAPGAAPRTITLFDLSDRNLRRHDPASLDKLFRAIR
jgi:hypothetical protein